MNGVLRPGRHGYLERWRGPRFAVRGGASGTWRLSVVTMPKAETRGVLLLPRRSCRTGLNDRRRLYDDLFVIARQPPPFCCYREDDRNWSAVVAHVRGTPNVFVCESWSSRTPSQVTSRANFTGRGRWRKITRIREQMRDRAYAAPEITRKRVALTATIVFRMRSRTTVEMFFLYPPLIVQYHCPY